MSEIQAGDVVVCVDTSERPLHPLVIRTGARRHLVLGRTYRVTRMWRGVSGLWFVRLAGFPHGTSTSGCDLCRFRKVEAPDTEISRRIRACKPIKQTEPAHPINPPPVLAWQGGVG